MEKPEDATHFLFEKYFLQLGNFVLFRSSFFANRVFFTLIVGTTDKILIGFLFQLILKFQRSYKIFSQKEITTLQNSGSIHI